MNPPAATPHPSRLWRCLRWLVLTPLVLATLVALAYAVENWRGERAWARVCRELAARGEPQELAGLVPPPIPDDQNLALAPLLRPVLAFHRGPDGNLVWEDRAGQNRLESVAQANWAMRTQAPEARSWLRGERTDLAAWQSYYRGLAEEAARSKPVPSAPPKPYRVDPVLAQRSGLPTNSVTAAPATNVVGSRFPQLRPLPPDLAARYGVATNLTEAEFRTAFTFPVPATPGPPAEDVLLALSLVGVELDALAAEAARRPLARFPVRYEQRPSWGILLPHLAKAKMLVTVLQLRATARLAAGQTDAAHSDTRLAMRLAELTRDEPFLISQMVRAAAWTLTLQPVWEGVTDHRWTEPQLAELSAQLRAVDLLAAIPRSLQGHQLPETVPASEDERQNLAEMYRSNFPQMADADRISPEQIELGTRFIRYGPRGWFYQNQVTTIRTVREEQARFTAWNGTPALTNLTLRPAVLPYRVQPYRFLADQFSLLLSLRNGVLQLVRGQAQLHLALTACALERHRLATGGYPATLEALVPRFLDRLPMDPMTGGPLRYARAADGTFRLYSVGADGHDDGGELTKRSDPPLANELTEPGPGDWVWATTKK